jgi:phosphoribosylglycinamide formyltransferase-1
MTTPRIVVLISGNGSNLQSIIDAVESDQLDARVDVVISNNPKAYGLSRARAHHIETCAFDHQQFRYREAFDAELLACTQSYNPDIIVLAGFMRILGSSYVQAYRNKILNIHPSLLPHYKGLDTYQRALDNDETEHGVSIHLVTAGLDDGPVLMQGRYPIETGDDAGQLISKGQRLEHLMYPKLLQLIGKKRLQISDQGIMYDHQDLTQPIEFESDSQCLD